MTYVIGDAVFTGDTIFMPDMGTARCDFPMGSPQLLYQSIQRVLGLPDSHRVFVGHDYQPGGREVRWETTVKDERAANVHVGNGTALDKFVEWRTTRDKSLGLPRLIVPSLQVNLRAGQLPKFIVIPVNKL
jgi:glyoxylase-like metal-dependent hydrolase (beta-lactamase superfamily II)